MTNILQRPVRWALLCLVCALCAFSAASSTASAQGSGFDEMTLPLRLQPEFLLKATGYDLKNKYGEGYRIGIIFSPTDKSSVAAAEIAQFLKPHYNNRPVHGFQIPFTTAAQLQDGILSNRINILYICPGNDRNLTTILEIAAQLGMLTSTGIERYVREGVALGLHGFVNGNSFKANYSVNTLVSRFDASFLYTVRRKYP